jgi:hypothetical protein
MAHFLQEDQQENPMGRYDDDDYPEDDYPRSFGDCDCDHDPEEHDFDSCTVPGCECEGHWED